MSELERFRAEKQVRAEKEHVEMAAALLKNLLRAPYYKWLDWKESEKDWDKPGTCYYW